MQSAVIYNEFDLGLSFFIIDQDMSEFQDVYINSYDGDNDKMNRLNDIMYEKYTGEFLHQKVSLEAFENAVQAGAKIVVCGFLP